MDPTMVVSVLVGAVVTGAVRVMFARLERRMEGVELLALRVEVLHERVTLIDRVLREVEGDVDGLRIEHARRVGSCGPR